LASADPTEVLVLDAPAFYAGVPLHGTATMYTTPEVLREVEHTTSANLHAVLASQRLVAQGPSPAALVRARQEARRRGELGTLSGADLSIIALALDLRDRGATPVVLSDDYGVQNLSGALALQWRPLMARGIRRVWAWTIYCPGCGKSFRSLRPKVCDVCGTALRRKPVRKHERADPRGA
jgi:rRNA maturation endonuclease Nob1